MVDNDTILVVDVEACKLLITCLVAKKSPELVKSKPTTQGIYWEHHPTFSLSSQLNLSSRELKVTYENFLEVYLNSFVNDDNMSQETRKTLIEYIIRTGN